jgi:ribonuclease HII
MSIENFEAGIDEAGRGCLAGPVVSAAVILPEGFTHPLIKDSKKLSPKKRKEAYHIIMENAVSVGIGIVSAEQIDKINILQATFQSMHAAISDLNILPTELLIDGDRFPGYKDIPYECIIKGDSKVPCISAASIIAKVTRDELMEKLAPEFSAYKWESNFGYGTADHMKALEEIGLSIHHRKTFCSRFL